MFTEHRDVRNIITNPPNAVHTNIPFATHPYHHSHPGITTLTIEHKQNDTTCVVQFQLRNSLGLVFVEPLQKIVGYIVAAGTAVALAGPEPKKLTRQLAADFGSTEPNCNESM